MVLKPKIIIGSVFMILTLILLYSQYAIRHEIQPIRIGILQSLSGTMAELEKPLVELMGGKINVENTPGKGSEFWIEHEGVIQ